MYWAVFYYAFVFLKDGADFQAHVDTLIVIFIVAGLGTTWEAIHLLSHPSFYDLSTTVSQLQMDVEDLRANECFHQILFFLCLSQIILAHPQGARKGFLYGGMVISAVSMLLSGSRGILVTTVLLSLILPFLLKRSAKRLLAIYCVVGITAVALTVVAGSSLPGVGARYAAGLNDVKVGIDLARSSGDYADYLLHKEAQDSDYSLIRKIVEAQAVWGEFRKSPVWGLGLGHEYRKLWMREDQGASYQESAYVHNAYNYMLMDTGIIGCALLLLVLYRIITNAWRLFKHTTIPAHKAYALACILSASTLSLNSLNLSFLLKFPYVAFLAFFAGGIEFLQAVELRASNAAETK
jgi:O-antigen ligase